jgi:hypothetical protein
MNEKSTLNALWKNMWAWQQFHSTMNSKNHDLSNFDGPNSIFLNNFLKCGLDIC